MSLRRRELLALLAAPCGASAEVMLAQVAPPGLDPTGYLVSEKYDGIRAVWDGQSLRHRSGRSVNAPGWFLARLPRALLDGELWMGRRSFEALSAAVRRAEPQDAQWQRIRYMIFEQPGGEGSFAQRHAALREVVTAAGWPALQAAEQRRVPDRAALLAWLREVVDGGGEGLMLHRADAPFVTGRTDALLKLKPVLDAEATVVAHVPGQGRLAGLLGALEVQDDAGLRFRLGTGFTDAQRRSPPPLGSRVTYTFRDRTPSGKPRFASFLRTADPD